MPMNAVMPMRKNPFGNRIGNDDPNSGYPDATEIMANEENDGGMMKDESEARASAPESNGIPPDKLAEAQIGGAFRTIQNLLIAMREKGNPAAEEAFSHYNALIAVLSGKNGNMNMPKNGKKNEMAFNPFKAPEENEVETEKEEEPAVL